jgi:hypothetical protein
MSIYRLLTSLGPLVETWHYAAQTNIPSAYSIARDSLVLDEDGVLLPVVNFDISSMTPFGVRNPRHYNAPQHQLPTMCAPDVFRVSGRANTQTRNLDSCCPFCAGMIASQKRVKSNAWMRMTCPWQRRTWVASSASWY